MIGKQSVFKHDGRNKNESTKQRAVTRSAQSVRSKTQADEGLLANTARSIGAVIGKIVAKTGRKKSLGLGEVISGAPRKIVAKKSRKNSADRKHAKSSPDKPPLQRDTKGRAKGSSNSSDVKRKKPRTKSANRKGFTAKG